ncbi:helix-turn-helix domain-containing protein [Miniphocaeibacter massiliensis]|uniref:helix-turn-helix domain-containing protein n=1 Tax=Miniphocaeibacter massiliensis TaxID=2041841 RepID=UPI000C06809D|nr:helix-turn-helix domain-containing protein [Miniphocaeibacter massiliensis]
MDIGKKLKEARTRAEMTQEELAEKIHVSRQTISSWENSRSYPDIISVIMLSDLYGISLDVLLKGDEEMIKNLEKSTNVVKSNKKVILSTIGVLLAYVMLYMLKKLRNESGAIIDNPIINMIMLGFFGIILIAYITKYIIDTKKKDSENLSKYIIIGLFGIACIAIIFITFICIGEILENKLVINTFRILSLVALSILFNFIYKKLFKNK